MTRAPRRRPAPLWLELALLALGAGVAHALDAPARDGLDLQLGVFGWVAVAASWIAAAFAAAAEATVIFLTWTVNVLWVVVRAIGNGLIFAGRAVVEFGREVWGYVEDLYDHVLQPMWTRFWRFIDWARLALGRIFRPVVEFLWAVRREILKFYDRFVRPVLDAIGIARRVVGIFRSLGFEWAKTLDAKLAAVDEWISARFQDVLGKVNEVINVVNRVVTADGLFQRLALIRSIERDIQQVSNAFYNWRRNPLTNTQTRELADANTPRPIAEILTEADEYLATGSGPIAGRITTAQMDERAFGVPR